MPVPDQVRDDGSGIQFQSSLKKYWIPGLARNDKSAVIVVLLIATQPLKGGETKLYDCVFGSFFYSDLGTVVVSKQNLE